jgi:hypothetical protein
MELGEPIKPPGILGREGHSKATCPWHQPGEGGTPEMPEPNPDDDVPDAIPANKGGTLGQNLTGAGEPPPSADSVEICYVKGSQRTYQAGKKRKIIQTYEESSDEEEYALQYAPHHVIPGNESLKNSPVVPYMGVKSSISKYHKSSYIKKGFIGYDVNSADNGVWLPSPYALSNKNGWPAEEGMEVLKRRRGLDFTETEEFKEAYVAATIEACDRQFHMRHVDYSDFVGKALKAIADRLAKMVNGKCPVAADSEEDGKFDPPYGLVGRLNVLSTNLKNHLMLGVWRDPLFTDEMTKAYAQDLKKTKRKLAIKKVL